MSDETNDKPGESVMVEVRLARVVVRDDADSQYIYLVESDGPRRFPIVIGSNEAREIYRVAKAEPTERPLTHQLAFDCIAALKAELVSVDIVDLRHNTYYANVVLRRGDETLAIDARPSDAIALATRARCRFRVAEDVMTRAAAVEDE